MCLWVDSVPADYNPGPHPISARCQFRERPAGERAGVRSQVLFIELKTLRKYTYQILEIYVR